MAKIFMVKLNYGLNISCKKNLFFIWNKYNDNKLYIYI